jgi:hypothetical protein
MPTRAFPDIMQGQFKSVHNVRDGFIELSRYELAVVFWDTLHIETQLHMDVALAGFEFEHNGIVQGISCRDGRYLGTIPVIVCDVLLPYAKGIE